MKQKQETQKLPLQEKMITMCGIDDPKDVLIVEEEDSSEWIAILLKKSGFSCTITQTENWEHALALLAGEKTWALIGNINLGQVGTKGVEDLVKLLETGKVQKFLCITTAAAAKDIESIKKRLQHFTREDPVVYASPILNPEKMIGHLKKCPSASTA
jgi:hypothetical protein